MSVRAWLTLVGVFVLLAGCAQTRPLHRETQTAPLPKPIRILLIEPEIELSLLTAAGLLEPRADWTEAGRGNVDAAIETMFAERDATLLDYVEPDDDATRLADDQLFKLHRTVGITILRYRYPDTAALPTKGDQLDWTLGPDTARLKDRYDADYALFVFLNDSYASEGRVAMMVVGLALFGVPLQGGLQFGFASLVNLERGDIVWFNRLVSTSGDLRTPGPARQTVEQLLADLPI